MRARVVTTIDAQGLVNTLEPMVLARIKSQRLALPAMPTVATSCLSLLQDPFWSMKTITATLSRDPVLTAQVLRLANGAAYGVGGIRTIDNAVVRLGSEQLRTVLVEACARKLFASRNPKIAAACVRLWEHSVGVALLAADLAASVRSAERETVYLAGLLHDVGKPVMASMLLEAERAIGVEGSSWLESDRWIGVVQRSHRTVGVALGESWKLPEPVLTSIRDCTGYDLDRPMAPTNFVRFANAVAKANHIYVGEVDEEETAAVVNTGYQLLGTTPESVERLLTDLDARIDCQA